MTRLPFQLVSPEKVLLDKEVTMVVIPGVDGDIGVLSNHAPLLTLLRPGVVTVYEEAKVLVKFFVNGGFADVTPQRCMALVAEGTLLEAIDKEALQIEVKNLLEDIADSRTPEERKLADQNLEIARTKLMEVLNYQKS